MLRIYIFGLKPLLITKKKSEKASSLKEIYKSILSLMPELNLFVVHSVSLRILSRFLFILLGYTSVFSRCYPKYAPRSR